MSHQRYPSEGIKEPHSVSLKVLRYRLPVPSTTTQASGPAPSNILTPCVYSSLSRPSLTAQYPIQPPLSSSLANQLPVPASLAYRPSPAGDDINPEPFILSPILNLPSSFGSAYVGETFSCTLCANCEVEAGDEGERVPRREIRDVRIEAEMKTPGSGGGTVRLELVGAAPTTASASSVSPGGEAGGGGKTGVDLRPGETLQRIVNFDLKEEGNHVLAVTVSYYEAGEMSGRTRTFRKLYQFMCKSSLIVRTKPGVLPPRRDRAGGRRWVLEAQLENCGEDVVRLERVVLDTEPGLAAVDCNRAWDWEGNGTGGNGPVLHPGAVEQVCFALEEEVVEGVGQVKSREDGRVVFGTLGIGWRGEMGNRGFLSTGKLGTRQGQA